MLIFAFIVSSNTPMFSAPLVTPGSTEITLDNVARVENLYDILGISSAATPDELRKAYRKLALQFHPDKNRENPKYAEEIFKSIKEAYEILSDDTQKSDYDTQPMEEQKEILIKTLTGIIKTLKISKELIHRRRIQLGLETGASSSSSKFHTRTSSPKSHSTHTSSPSNSHSSSHTRTPSPKPRHSRTKAEEEFQAEFERKQAERKRAERERAEREKERFMRAQLEKERLAREKLEKERLAREKLEKEIFMAEQRAMEEKRRSAEKARRAFSRATGRTPSPENSPRTPTRLTLPRASSIRHSLEDVRMEIKIKDEIFTLVDSGNLHFPARNPATGLPATPEEHMTIHNKLVGTDIDKDEWKLIFYELLLIGFTAHEILPDYDSIDTTQDAELRSILQALMTERFSWGTFKWFDSPINEACITGKAKMSSMSENQKKVLLFFLKNRYQLLLGQTSVTARGNVQCRKLREAIAQIKDSLRAESEDA